MSADDVERQEQGEGTRPGRTFEPNVDIVETPDAIRLWADMPGVPDGEVDVQLRDGVLSIEGAVDLGEYQDLSPAYTEYNIGNFIRRFTISADIDGDKIHGRMTDGVLQLELPKAERVKPRRVPIRAK